MPHTLSHSHTRAHSVCSSIYTSAHIHINTSTFPIPFSISISPLHKMPPPSLHQRTPETLLQSPNSRALDLPESSFRELVRGVAPIENSSALDCQGGAVFLLPLFGVADAHWQRAIHITARQGSTVIVIIAAVMSVVVFCCVHDGVHRPGDPFGSTTNRSALIVPRVCKTATPRRPSFPCRWPSCIERVELRCRKPQVAASVVQRVTVNVINHDLLLPPADGNALWNRPIDHPLHDHATEAEVPLHPEPPLLVLEAPRHPLLHPCMLRTHTDGPRRPSMTAEPMIAVGHETMRATVGSRGIERMLPDVAAPAGRFEQRVELRLDAEELGLVVSP
mmetsp:Transcript_33284/g.96104  ORF Transcript_33284/g.96104 Transcript_33284/m.96104 type:complete len:334 (-) Transcript_33284:303-1304(-)